MSIGLDWTKYIYKKLQLKSEELYWTIEIILDLILIFNH